MENKQVSSQKFIKCTFLPAGEISLHSSVHITNNLSYVLQKKYKIPNKIVDNNILITSTTTLGTIKIIGADDNNHTKPKFTRKEQDIILFLSSDIQYGVLKEPVDNALDYEIMKKMPFRDTSHYTSYFDWIPENIVELNYENNRIKKSKMKKRKTANQKGIL